MGFATVPVGTPQMALTLTSDSIIIPPSTRWKTRYRKSRQAGNYSAEYGIYGGIHANYVLKSGTNAFHGDAWEYVENNDLDARNFFSPTVAPIKQNEFGGVFGGPIRKNKTFFFLTYQGIRCSIRRRMSKMWF